jgi:phosphoglycolate phosphatase/pyrophosphatase PpaX
MDHDETVVRSTETVHYPAYREAIAELRPELEALDLEGFLRVNFDPGFFYYLENILEYTVEENERAYEIWRKWTRKVVPEPFPGIIEALKAYKDAGGVITVVSHSVEETIRRDYEAFGSGLMPDLICGWVPEKRKVKPEPYPVEKILSTFHFKKDEALIVDDSMPGLLMSENSAVSIAGAGWGDQIPEIIEHMRTHCEFFFDSVEEFRGFVLTGSGS